MAINNVEALSAESLNELELTKKQKSVLRASLTLFSEQGFDRTSTSDIARVAGVSEGTVYKQFKTKEGILKALLGPFIQQVLPKAAGEFLDTFANTNVPDFETFLRRIVADRLTFFETNKLQLKIFIQEILSNSDMAATFINKTVGGAITRITAVMKFYQQKNEIVDWDPVRIVRYIMSTMLGYALPNLIQPDKKLNIEQSTDEVVEFIMRGIGIKKS